ncbi:MULTISPECIES: hypothetical protein [unclassified Moorena]|uniref:hypothetical protein n=1 Tax=unclassified Moorena TaxID=2683338 RepID=UPI0013C778AF|nr:MULTISPECIES: hypothetical protein [unclassified Moorena]NEO23061.1 hypothetical protein [Moorena sp. SIO4A5]NEP25532.1 hypothetical protein [Moorena sp. SIO3I6]NEQ61924.1 hypothetical protein [Moorena sp. SIO4A1]
MGFRYFQLKQARCLFHNPKSSPFPIPDSRFPIPDSRLPTPYSLLPYLAEIENYYYKDLINLTEY